MVDALLVGGEAAADAARDQLAAAAGPVTAAAAVAVIANFQMMNRILDATGIPTPPDRVGLAAEIGVDPDAFGGAHRSV